MHLSFVLQISKYTENPIMYFMSNVRISSAIPAVHLNPEVLVQNRGRGKRLKSKN